MIINWIQKDKLNNLMLNIKISSKAILNMETINF